MEEWLKVWVEECLDPWMGKWVPHSIPLHITLSPPAHSKFLFRHLLLVSFIAAGTALPKPAHGSSMCKHICERFLIRFMKLSNFKKQQVFLLTSCFWKIQHWLPEEEGCFLGWISESHMNS